MSELKEHKFCECDEIVREYRGQLSNEMRPYYLKSEADKVIARHKYKRCLAMATWCDAEGCWYENQGEDIKASWFFKWEHKWLELAKEPTWAKFLQLIHKEEK